MAGYWDFLAPDLTTFREIVTPTLPEFVYVLGVPVQRDVLVIEAWTAPFSGAGIALRAIYFGQLATAVQPAAEAAWDAVNKAVLASPGQSITLKGPSNVAALVIANVYRCSIRMISGGKDIVNVVHVEGTTTGQQAAAAAAVLAAWKVANGPLSQLSNLVAMQDVTAMDLSSVNGGISVVTDTTVGGLSVSPALATRGACALIKVNGGTRSRSTRGRIYYGPIREADINSDGATLGGTFKTAADTAFAAFKTSLTGASFTPGVASRKTSSFTSAGTYVSETTIATQRRRIRS